MVFKQLGEDTDKFQKNFGLLSKSFQDIKKDLSNGLGIRQGLFSFVKKEDIQALNNFNKAIQNGTNYTEAFDTYLSKVPISIKRQANELIKLNNQQKQLNQQLNKGKISQQEYDAQMSSTKSQIQAITTQTESLTLKQRALEIRSKAAGAAMNLAFNMGIALVINGIISLISYLVKREGELAENAKEASNRYKEQVKGLDELKNKYQEICDSEETEAEKIANLNELKKELINNYGLTEDALKNLNTEREEGIRLLDEEISKMNRRDRNLLLNENREAYNKAVKKIENVNPNVAQDTISTLNVDNISDNIKKMFSKIGEDDLFNWSGQVETYFEIDADNIIDQYDKIGDVISALTDKKNTYNGITDDEAHLLYLLNNTYKKLGKTIETHGDNYKDYYSYYAQNKFEDFESGYDFGAEGANDYNTYRKALLDSAGNDKKLKSEFEKILSDKFSNEDSNLTSQTEVTILPSVSADTSKLKSNLDSLKEQINDIFKNTDLFDKAIESLNKGEAIDFDSVMSMMEVDSSLADKFVQTADGYTIAVDKLIEARQKYTEETRASIQADIESSKQSIKVAEQNIKDLEAKRNAINPASDLTKWKAYDDAIKSEKKNIEELNQVISEDTLILGEMEKGVSSAKSSIEDFSTTIDNASKKQSVLKSAMEDMADTGFISASTYAQLIEMGGNFTDCLEVQNGKIVLNVEKLKELEKQEYLNVVAANELRIAELQLAADNIKSDPTGYLTKIINDRIEELKEQNALYNTLAEEIENVKPNSSSSSSSKSDKPQSVLDYEKWVAEQEHKIAMGRLKEDEAYYDEKLRRAEIAYSGLADYESDLWKVQEEVYKFREKLAQEAFDKEHDLFEKRVDDLEDYADKLSETSVTSDGTNLTTQEKWQEVAAVYKEIQSEIEREINRIVQSGVEGNEDLLEELEKQWDKYADKISDTFKSAVEAEKSLLENQKSSLSDVYDKQIDKIKKQQDDAKKSADAEIDLIQEKIDNLKKVNDEKQQEYDIEKAKQELENKKQRTRMTYGSDGTIVYEQDTEAIAEAQQNLDKLLLEKQVDTLETQKSLLEDMRDKESESYDKLIEDIESQKEQDERQFDILIQRLEDYLNPNSDTSNSDVWSEIAKMDGASYRNGKWVDKDGTEIDVAKLLSKADEIVDSNNKVADSNNKVEDNVKTDTANKKSGNEDKASTDKDNVKKNASKTDSVKKESQTEKVNNQLETAADIIGKIAVSADDFVSTILKTLGATSVKDLWTKSSNGIPNGNQVLSSQHDTSKWIANRDNYVTNNTNQPMSFNFGDINVNNPVGDAKKLAEEVKGKIFREAMMQIPNDAMKIIHSNLK